MATAVRSLTRVRDMAPAPRSGEAFFVRQAIRVKRATAGSDSADRGDRYEDWPQREAGASFTVAACYGETVRPSVPARIHGLSAGARQTGTVTTGRAPDERGGRRTWMSLAVKTAPTPARR